MLGYPHLGLNDKAVWRYTGKRPDVPDKLAIWFENMGNIDSFLWHSGYRMPAI